MKADDRVFPGGELPEHQNRPCGLTVRDYIAIQAMSGKVDHQGWDASTCALMAKTAYMMADALITESEK